MQQNQQVQYGLPKKASQSFSMSQQEVDISDQLYNEGSTSMMQKQSKQISTFDRIIKDSANGANSMVSGAKMNTIKSSSRQKTRKNKVILPKIMFYNQSGSSKQLELPSLENSDRLISMDRATIDHFPMGNNQLDFSSDEIAGQLANE